MRICSITPCPGDQLILRWYETDHSAASDIKSSADTAPSVTSRMRIKCARRGIRPFTYREIAACRTPIFSANPACDMPLLERNSESFMLPTYQSGIGFQAQYTKAGLDGVAASQYHYGMGTAGWQALRKHREQRGLSQGALAAAIGSQQSQISRWERDPTLPDGEPRKIGVDWAVRLGNFFGVRPAVFRPEMDDPTGSFDELLQDAPAELREAIYRDVVKTLVKRAQEAAHKDDAG